jgi:hypothetical protein
LSNGDVIALGKQRQIVLNGFGNCGFYRDRRRRRRAGLRCALCLSRGYAHSETKKKDDIGETLVKKSKRREGTWGKLRAMNP